MQSSKDVFILNEQKKEKPNQTVRQAWSGNVKARLAWLEQVMESLLPKIVHGFAVVSAEVFVKQEKTSELVHSFFYPTQAKAIWKNEKYLLGEGAVGKAAQQVGCSLYDIQAENHPDINPALKELEIQSVHCFPMRSESGVMGLLCLACKQKQPFNNKQTELLSGLANWAGMLLHFERQTLETQRQIVMDERERIGMDLHDGIIQSLYAVGLTLQNANLLLAKDLAESKHQIEIATDALNEAIRDIRAYILDLRPRQLRGEDLFAGMQSLIREFRANTFVEVEFTGNPQVVQGLSEENTEALFHIFQEALANIAKHASAEKVHVRLWRTADRLMLRINDDGRGFDMSKVSQRIGHGLSNMQTRAEAVGGGLEVISIRRQGTTVLAWVSIL